MVHPRLAFTYVAGPGDRTTVRLAGQPGVGQQGDECSEQQQGRHRGFEAWPPEEVEGRLEAADVIAPGRCT